MIRERPGKTQLPGKWHVYAVVIRGKVATTEVPRTFSKKMNTTSNKQFICFRPRENATKRIICFPPAGVGASFYSKWHQRLPEAIEVWALQLPQREFLTEQKLTASVPELLSLITGEITEIIDKSTTLYGHNFGASLAFLATSWLEQHCFPPENLIVSARKSITAVYNPLVSQLEEKELIH